MLSPEREFVGFSIYIYIFLLESRYKWDLSGESFEGKVFLVLIVVVGRWPGGGGLGMMGLG